MVLRETATGAVRRSTAPQGRREMQIAQQGTAANTAIGVDVSEPGGAARRSPYADYKIIRRNGAVVGFEPAKISVAMTKAFIAVRGGQGAASAAIGISFS